MRHPIRNATFALLATVPLATCGLPDATSLDEQLGSLGEEVAALTVAVFEHDAHVKHAESLNEVASEEQTYHFIAQRALDAVGARVATIAACDGQPDTNILDEAVKRVDKELTAHAVAMEEAESMSDAQELEIQHQAAVAQQLLTMSSATNALEELDPATLCP